MSIIFDKATKADIDELIRLRLEFIADDHGPIAPQDKASIEQQLRSFFDRKLGTELVAFVARDADSIVSVAYLSIFEMPANCRLLNGLYGEVFSVYTIPSYRGKGICTTLMQQLVAEAKSRGLGCIDLRATKDGYPIYKKLGFVEKEQHYTDMRLEL